jgi:hypothetical protein
MVKHGDTRYLILGKKHLTWLTAQNQLWSVELTGMMRALDSSVKRNRFFWC